MAIDPKDKNYITAGNGRGTLRVWGPGQYYYPAHTGAVTSVAVHPRQNWVASGGADGTVKLRIGDSFGRATFTAKPHTAAVTGVAFSGDGRMLATASDDNTVSLWEITGSKRLASPPARGSDSFGPGADGFGGDMPTPRGRPGAAAGGLSCVVFSPTDDRIAYGRNDGAVEVWEIGTVKPAQQLTGHTGGVRAVAFTVDGRHLVSAAADGFVKVWDLTAGKEVLSMSTRLTKVRCAALNRDGTTAAIGSGETVEVWAIPGSDYYKPAYQKLFEK